MYQFSRGKKKVNEVIVTKSYMIPWQLFYKGKPLAFLSLEVMNLESTPILITSAEVTLNGTNGKLARNGKIDPALSSSPENNEPVLLKPGQKKLIQINIGFEMKNILPTLNDFNLQNEMYAPYDDFNVLLRTDYVSRLNNKISQLYGKNSYIEINLYTGYKDILYTNKFYLTNGTDLFDHSGNIDWSIFLGMLADLQQKNKFRN